MYQLLNQHPNILGAIYRLRIFHTLWRVLSRYKIVQATYFIAQIIDFSSQTFLYGSLARFWRWCCCRIFQCDSCRRWNSWGRLVGQVVWKSRVADPVCWDTRCGRFTRSGHPTQFNSYTTQNPILYQHWVCILTSWHAASPHAMLGIGLDWSYWNCKMQSVDFFFEILSLS